MTAAAVAAAPRGRSNLAEVEPMLRLNEVAHRLQVTRQTVRKLMQRGELKFMRVGREVRFKREWVEDYIERTGRAATVLAKRRK